MDQFHYPLESFVICGLGKVRLQNEDNFFLNGFFRDDYASSETVIRGPMVSDGGLFAVADGMGGEKRGEVASWIAVRSMKKLLYPGIDQLETYLKSVNDEICEFILRNSGEQSGTTFAGLSIHGETVDVINVGDSRIYLMRNGHLHQLSEDHTLSKEMLDIGLITDREARQIPERHMLTQKLGMFSDQLLDPFVITGSVQCDDLFLLCSDGLYDMLDDQTVQSALSGEKPIRDRGMMLFQAALDAGGKDNLTVMLIRVLPRQAAEAYAPSR